MIRDLRLREFKLGDDLRDVLPCIQNREENSQPCRISQLTYHLAKSCHAVPRVGRHDPSHLRDKD